jgi:hypothetical protein
MLYIFPKFICDGHVILFYVTNSSINTVDTTVHNYSIDTLIYYTGKIWLSITLFIQNQIILHNLHKSNCEALKISTWI